MTCPFCDREHPSAVPSVHLNGTSAEELYTGLDGAIQSLRQTIRAIVNAAPNGRDYYPTNNIREAMDEHRVRMLKLDDVLKELTEQRDHVQSVIDFKEATRRSR